MSKINKEIKLIQPKKGKAASKTILLDFETLPQAWRWLERQAHTHDCSKTAYIKALIELNRKEQEDS